MSIGCDLHIAVEQVHIFAHKSSIRGITRASIQDCGIAIDNITWRLKKGKIEVKFPVVKDKKNPTKPRFLVSFEGKAVEKAIKQMVKLEVKTYLDAGSRELRVEEVCTC